MLPVSWSLPECSYEYVKDADLRIAAIPLGAPDILATRICAMGLAFARRPTLVNAFAKKRFRRDLLLPCGRL